MNEERDWSGSQTPSQAPGDQDADPEPAPTGTAGTERVGEAGSGPAGGAGPDSESERDNVVINHFYDQVLGGSIGIGHTSANPLRQRTGKVAAGDIARAMRYYLPPPAYDHALSVLTGRRLVVLIGAEGSGRAASSIALATQVSSGGSDLVRLPPSYTLADVTRYRGFKPGQASLLHDWSAPATDDDAWFDLDQLLAKLKDNDAYLIITTDKATGARACLRDVAVEWDEPYPAALFGHCLARMATPELSDGDLLRLTERAVQLRWPRHVVHLAELCIDGAEVALAEMGDAERDTVTDWLNSGPARRDVLSVTALAFVSGVAELRYEHLAAVLADIETTHRLGPDAVVTVGQRTADQPFIQRRTAQLSRSPLAALLVERDPAVLFGVPFRPRFRSEDQRQLMIAALHEYFGHELWAPVRDWLFQLAGEPFDEEHLMIGSGLALLARCALGEVEQTYLDPWAAGPMQSRLLATDVLWAMARDDLLAPRALQLVVSWVRHRGAERAMTAAICLGGPLGQRYPSEAIRWLWELSQRAERIAIVARTAMARLFASEADATAGLAGSTDPAGSADSAGAAGSAGADDGPAASCVVPRRLLRKVRPLVKPGAPVRDRRAALDLVNAVLAARGTTSAATAAACVVRGHPADIDPVGELWAMTLRSVRHRSDAIIALHDTLLALVPGPAPAAAAARLGKAIVPRLSPDTLRSLHLGLADPRRARAESRAVIKAFLDARTTDGLLLSRAGGTDAPRGPAQVPARRTPRTDPATAMAPGHRLCLRHRPRADRAA